MSQRTRLRTLSPALVGALLALTYLLIAPPLAAQQRLPTIELKIRGHAIRAEVAASHATRARGLMERDALGRDEGMLFVFREAMELSMWMRNTTLPLSVAFIDANGHILNIVHMEPLAETPHSSNGPGLYALEMEQGWFTKHGIRRGDKVESLAAAGKAPE